MSRSENGSVSSPASHQQRLCHIVKRDDFDGYGFNLHSEKGKPGQYIGKVDENSPAEQAGVRQGDRIIEVNGVNIGSETHKQVVQRIKAITNEVRLLVIDPSVEKKSGNKVVVVNDNNTSTVSTATSTITVQSSTVHAETTSISSQKATNKHLDDSIPPPPGSTSPATSVKSDTNSTTSGANTTNLNNNNTISNGSNKISDADTNIPQSSSSSSSSQQQQQQNGTTSTTGANAELMKQSTGLNLPMTAAEMRAKLLAKKKYDPKNDSVDLRKKFEIIQKL